MWGRTLATALVVAACGRVDFDEDCTRAAIIHVPECTDLPTALEVAQRSHRQVLIDVAEGTYIGNYRFGGAPALVVGAGPGRTILQGSGTGPVVEIVDGEDARSGLGDLTITGGECTPMSDMKCEGGGIQIQSASPTLERIEVTGNRATAATYPYGAGISLNNSSARLVDVDVHDNTSTYYGGGIFIRGAGSVELIRARIVRNSATYGGGLAMYFTSPHIENITLVANDASAGGGAFCQGGSPAFDSATFVANTCTDGCGVYAIGAATVSLRGASLSGGRAQTSAGALYASGGSTTSVSYSSFFDNGAAPFSGVASPIGSSGNIAADPVFELTGGDPNSWNLHLGVGSALVDAGDPAISDRDGSREDIGAYGGPNAPQ